jgi:hypothetical protein
LGRRSPNSGKKTRPESPGLGAKKKAARGGGFFKLGAISASSWGVADGAAAASEFAEIQLLYRA